MINMNNILNFSDCIEGMQPLQGTFTKEIMSLDTETNQENNTPIISSCSKFIAITIQQTLSVYNIDLSINNHETLFKIDFDENILSITWDVTESCLILGDASGSLHLITCDGNLLFSKKVLNDFKTQRILHLQFLLSNDKNEQTLYIIMDNGSCLVINNMDPTSILELSRNTPNLLASHFQKLSINKASLSVLNKINQVILTTTTNNNSNNEIQEIKVVLKDENNQLILLNTDKSIQNITSTKTIYADCSDFYVFECYSIPYVLALCKNQDIVLIDLSTCRSIAQLTSKSYISKLSIVTCSKQSIGNHVNNEIFQMLILLHNNTTNRNNVDNTQLDCNELNSDIYQLISLSLLDNIGKFINLSTPAIKTAVEMNNQMITNNNHLMPSLAIDYTYFILTNQQHQKMKLFKYSDVITSIWHDLQMNNQIFRIIENNSFTLSMNDIALIIHDIHKTNIKNKEDVTTNSLSTVLTNDLYIHMITSLTSFVDILNITYLLLDYPNPEKGFILTLLSTSENAIEKIHSKQNQQAMKQKCLLEILKLHHYYETVVIVFNLKEHDNKDGSISEEELLRTSLLELLPNNIMDTVVQYLSVGEIQKAITVIQRCSHSEMHTDHTKLLRLIPDNTPVDELIAWIKDIVLSNITSLSFSTVLLQPTEHFDQNLMNNIISMASELVARAQKMEKVNGNPFDAIKLLNTAIEATAVIPYSYENAIPLMNQIKCLYQNMRLQAKIWEHWDDHFSLEDVISLGFKGLAFDRIDCIAESELIQDINLKIMPLVESFYELGMDSLLMGWIKESIAIRIVVAGDDLTNDADEKENCSFTRLVKVTSLIQDKNIQAKMVLTLLQMPVLEEMSNANMSLNNVEDDDIYNNLSKKSSMQSRASLHCESTRILCDLATTTYDYVDVASREALVEATRLLKVKAIASNYGIESFDPRNSKQVRAVVAIIANSVDHANAIQDGVEFSASWGSNSIDVNAILTRALILRATNFSIYSENNMKFEIDLKQTLEVLPINRKHIIIEDALKYLIDELEEATEYLVYDPIINKVLTVDPKVSTDEVLNAEMIVRSTMILVSFYIDFLKADATTDSIVATIKSNKQNSNCDSTQTKSYIAGTFTAKKRTVRIQSSMNRFWINSELLINLKRVYSLQTYGIYLCLNDLDNKEICQAVVSKLAKSRGLFLLQSLNERDVQSKSIIQHLTHLNTPLNSTCRKICVLLNICTTFFIHTTMKFLVESSEAELAMEVAETLKKEKLLYSSNNFTSYAQNTSDYLNTNGSGGGRDINACEIDIEAMKETSLLLDAAVTLCSIAAKKANQISQEDYSMLPSLSLLGCDDVIPEYISFPIASFKLSRDLLRSSVVCCPSIYLGRTLDLINGSETVLSVYDRVEGVNKAIKYGDINSVSKCEIISGVISDGSFARDGILMQPETVVLPLMKFAFGEIKRRELHSYIKQSNHNTLAINKPNNNIVEQHAPDLEEIVRILQRSENHLLAARVLYGSWHNSSFKAKALCSSLLSLGRKVLTYREIDIPFSVACLAALSYETMVKELKSAVPNIQNDFSRLQIVALVGEELSHLWDQESLLLLFQGLQMNAKWWSILSSLGMKVDLRIFQNPDANIREKFMKSIIPDLLEKGNMDLDMVTEYCRQFDLEPEYATLTYIESLLTSSPKSIHDFSWISKVRNASEHVEDIAVLLKLKELLPRIHSLDYEKIRYVCTWIMDLLASAEEEIDSPMPSLSTVGGGGVALPSDSIENIPPSHNKSTLVSQNSRSSLKDKALKVPVVALVCKSVMDSSNGVTEIESYKRYFDIATYLAGLKFPKEATATITSQETNDKNFTYRKNLADSYQERIPIWQLFNDPWSVLDPLLTEAPECASKLAPLCATLKIDKSLFNSRKIMALYTRMTARREGGGSISSIEYSAAHKECKHAAIATACESIETSIPNLIQQLELWKWIYLKERTNADDEFSIFALENALKIAKKHPKCVQLSHIQDYKLLTLESLTQEMRFLKCEHAIKRFHNNCLGEVPQVKDMLFNTLSNPTLLIRYLLEVTMEIAWDRYTQDIQQLGSVVTVLSLTNYPPSHEVLAFIHKASIVIDEIAQYCNLNCTLQQTSVQSQDNHTILQPTQLEVIRHHLIGKMLSDIDNNNHSTTSNSYDKDGSSQSTTTNFSSNINTTSCSVGNNTGMKHAWGVASEDKYAYLPSSAEKRRREDLHLSLSIASLVLSCSNINQRQAYMTQLDTVFRGKGVRVMRRLTSRSKYRACQALSYLQMNHNKDLDMKKTSNATNELNLFRNYLYCLSEMHEIRLPCSDELLQDAMGLSMVADTNEIQKVHSCDPRALVRTWIHDEGTHLEVVELARDLLLVCQYGDTMIWFQLIQHMINKSQHRVLLQTLVITSKSKVFSELCFGSMLGCELLLAMSKQYTETIDRVEKTIQLAQLREKVDHTITCDADWLSLSAINTINNTGNDANGNNTTNDHQSTTAINNNNIHSLLIGDLHKRVFITPKLAYRSGDWEESPPEDVFLSFTHIAIIIQHILHNLPSRMKYGQMKCTIAMNTIQLDCLKIGNLLNNFNNNNSNSKRNIMKMTLQSIMFCLNSLLNPSIYHFKQSCKESYQSCINQLVDILLNLSNNNDTTTTNTSHNKEHLWNVLTIIVKKFDKNNIVNDVFYDFIVSKKSMRKHQMMLLFEIIGMFSNSVSVSNNNIASDNNNVEEIAITFIQFIANRMVANDLDILDIKQAVLEQSIEVKKNLIKQMKVLLTKKNINIDKIQILIQNILS